jgi:urease accessory protein
VAEARIFIRVSRAGLQGHLRLTCSANSAGQSYLREQSFRAPLHISKSYWDGDSLLVQVINPTAGLFAGDSVEMEVRVEPGARLTLNSPSACRVHTMRETQFASISQRLVVAAGGRLQIMPQLLIPQASARLRQNTRIEIEPGGELVFFEVIAPGRVASGEVFQFASLDFDLRITHARTLVARERFCLRNDDTSIAALRAAFPNAYYASCFIFSPRIEANDSRWRNIRELHSAQIWIGASPLFAGGWVVKMLAGDSASLRRALNLMIQQIAGR